MSSNQTQIQTISIYLSKHTKKWNREEWIIWSAVSNKKFHGIISTSLHHTATIKQAIICKCQGWEIYSDLRHERGGGILFVLKSFSSNCISIAIQNLTPIFMSEVEIFTKKYTKYSLILQGLFEFPRNGVQRALSGQLENILK